MSDSEKRQNSSKDQEIFSRHSLDDLDTDNQTFEESINNYLDREENTLPSNNEEVQSETNKTEMEKSSSLKEVVEIIEFENQDEEESKLGMKTEKNGCDDPLTIEFIDMRPIQDKALYGFVPSAVLLTFFLLVLYTTLFLLCAGLYKLIVIFKNTAFLLIICFVLPILSVIFAIVFYLKISECRRKRNTTKASRESLIRDYKYDEENIGVNVINKVYPSVEISRSRGSSEHSPRLSIPNPSKGDTFVRQHDSSEKSDADNQKSGDFKIIDGPMVGKEDKQQSFTISLSREEAIEHKNSDFVLSTELNEELKLSSNSKFTFDKASSRTRYPRVSVSRKNTNKCFCFGVKTAPKPESSLIKKDIDFSNLESARNFNQPIDYDKIVDMIGSLSLNQVYVEPEKSYPRYQKSFEAGDSEESYKQPAENEEENFDSVQNSNNEPEMDDGNYEWTEANEEKSIGTAPETLTEQEKWLSDTEKSE